MQSSQFVELVTMLHVELVTMFQSTKTIYCIRYLQHITFSMCLSAVFALGNARQLFRFHSDDVGPPADSRIDSHLVVDACIHAVNMFQLIGFAEKMTMLFVRHRPDL